MSSNCHCFYCYKRTMGPVRPRRQPVPFQMPHSHHCRVHPPLHTPHTDTELWAWLKLAPECSWRHFLSAAPCAYQCFPHLGENRSRQRQCFLSEAQSWCLFACSWATPASPRVKWAAQGEKRTHRWGISWRQMRLSLRSFSPVARAAWISWQQQYFSMPSQL